MFIILFVPWCLRGNSYSYRVRKGALKAFSGNIISIDFRVFAT